LFNLISQINSTDRYASVNHIFFVGENVDIEELSSSDIKLLKEYKIKNFYFDHDKNFNTTYLKDLFFDLEFKTVVNINKTLVQIFDMNLTKSKIIEEKTIKTQKELIEIIVKYSGGLINGVTSLTKNLLLPNWIINSTNLNREEIMNEFNKEEQSQIHKDLKITIDMLFNVKQEGLILRGTVEIIRQAIEDYLVKELYVTEEINDQLKGIIDDDCFNFDIKIVKNVEKGDIHDKLVTDFGGVIGILYYCS
jgi:hypothetical protein